METVNGKDALKLSYSEPTFCAAVETNFLYKEGSQIHYYDEVKDTFFLLYDFALNQGESYNLYSNNYDFTSKITIDSIGVFDFNGRNLKVQYLISEGAIDFGGMTIEEIGNLYFLFPYYAVCDPQPIAYLRCYTNAIDGDVHFGEYDCTEEGFVSVSEVSGQDFSLSPNPATDKIELITSTPSSVRILDITGAVLLEIDNTGNKSQSIDISSLPAGVYIMKVQNTQIQTLKFLKQ